jgi:ABC-type transporter Mla subunit MlaD
MINHPPFSNARATSPPDINRTLLLLATVRRQNREVEGIQQTVKGMLQTVAEKREKIKAGLQKLESTLQEVEAGSKDRSAFLQEQEVIFKELKARDQILDEVMVKLDEMEARFGLLGATQNLD